MGSSVWSDDFYNHRETERKVKKIDTFVHDTKIRRGEIKAGTAKHLDPKGVLRESRDSVPHPNSVAIGVMVDVTGSMHNLPRHIQKQLPKLANLTHEHTPDAQILFGAVGDAISDLASLQVGQFESGNEMEDCLTDLYLEGGGGGSGEESYQNAAYFFARHTSCDCWEERQKKGYLFFIGDERNHRALTLDQAQNILGDGLETSLSTEDIYREVQEKFHVFFIIPPGAHHSRERSLFNHWAELIGSDHVFYIDNIESISELIATTIGLTEKAFNLGEARQNLTDKHSVRTANTVCTSLEGYAGSLNLRTAGDTPRTIHL